MINKTAKLPRALLDIRGMTIVEVLTVVGLVLVIVGAGVVPFMIQQEYLQKQFNRTRLQDELSVAMAYITKDIFRSKSCDVPSASSMVLTIGTGPLESDELQVTYDLLPAKQELRRTVSGSPVTLSRDMTGDGLVVSKPKNNYVNVKIKARKDGQTITLESSMALRAVSASP